MTAPRLRMKGHARLKSKSWVDEGGIQVAQGLCECGATSKAMNIFTPDGWNRFVLKWHRAHKQAVAAGKERE